MITSFHTYHELILLGDKPMRQVYRATSLNEPATHVVLKIFEADCLNSDYEYDNFIERCNFIKQLQHEHIVPVIDIGIIDERLYVVTPYISDISLASLRNQRVSASWKPLQVLDVALQIAQGLNYMHACGIAHGNLKPENVLFSAQEKAMLTDFSMAGLLNEHKLGDRSDAYNVRYMAPEQDLDQSSELSDQYGFACLIYELLTGQTPFSGNDFSIVQLQKATQTPPAPSQLVPGILPMLDQALIRALSPEPDERFPSLPAFLAALQKVFHTLQPGPLSLIPTDTQAFFQSYEMPQSHQSNAQEPETNLPVDEPPIQEQQSTLATLQAIQSRKTPNFPFSALTQLHKTLPPRPAEQIPEETKQPDVPESPPPVLLSVPDKDEKGTLSENSGNDTPPVDSHEGKASGETTITIISLDTQEEKVSPGEFLSDQASWQEHKQERSPILIGEHAKSQGNQNIPTRKNRYTVFRHTHLLIAGVLIFALIGMSLNILFFRDQRTFLTSTETTPATTMTQVPTAQPTPTIQPTITPQLTPTSQPTATPQPTAPPLPPATPTLPPTIPPTTTVQNNAPVESTIWLQSTTNTFYVSARLTDTDIPLRAEAQGISTWEHFEVVDAGNGAIVLRDFTNGYYVSVASSEENAPLQVTSIQPDEHAYFLWIERGDGTISLQSQSTGKYVTISRSEPHSPLYANGVILQTAERFNWNEV